MTEKHKKRLRKTVFNLIMFIFSLLYIIPIWMVLVNSLKLPADANKFGIGLPNGGVLQLGNYIKVIKDGGIPLAFFNGLIEATGSVVLIILTASACAFVISRRKSKLTEAAFFTFILGIIIPVAFIPTYLVLNTLHLIDTYAGIILIFTTYGLPMAIFLYSGFIKTVPRELDEAAILDGCGTLRMFYMIIFPLLKPVTVTIFILSFIGAWNDVMIPLFFVNGDKWALPLTVYNFYGTYIKSWNLIFADIIITISPLLIVYIIGQKHIVTGMTSGAVKG